MVRKILCTATVFCGLTALFVAFCHGVAALDALDLSSKWLIMYWLSPGHQHEFYWPALAVIGIDLMDLIGIAIAIAIAWDICEDLRKHFGKNKRRA